MSARLRLMHLKRPAHPVFGPAQQDPTALAASELMAEAVLTLPPAQRTVALNMAADTAVPFLAERGGLTVIDEHQMALDYAATMLRRNLPACKVTLRQADLRTVPVAAADVICLNLRYLPDKAVLHDCLRWAAQALDVHGHLIVVGPKQRGGRGVAAVLAEYFSKVSDPVYRKGNRLHLAAHALPQAPASPVVNRFEASAQGYVLTLTETPGIFNDGRVDEGARLLAAHLPTSARPLSVLDLGCGSGFLGLLAARLYPEASITCVDEYARAVTAARDNAETNGLAQRVTVIASNGYSALGTAFYDLVLLNPPFHFGGIQTPALAQALIAETARHLRRHGELWLVANRFLPYEETLRAHYGTVTLVAQAHGFKVLRATATPQD